MKTVTTPKIGAGELVLCLAFELGASEWKMAFSTGLGQQPRHRTIRAGDFERLDREISAAKTRFGLCAEARVLSCYEAGRDGFWIHRALVARGIENQVVDSASIEVNRRKRRAKTDRLDAGKLVGMLLRYLLGDQRVWSVVRVPSPADEDRRHLHRELATAKKDRTRLVNRIKALLFSQGVRLEKIQELPERLEKFRLWNGEPLPPVLKRRLKREWEKIESLTEQIRKMRAERRRLLRKETDPGTIYAGKLLKLKGVGETSGWALATEFFGWREFRNAREVGGLAGLTPTPYQSGDDTRELEICKAGNRWVRHLSIELAWGWLRYQPESELSLWYQRRFGHGTSRMRRVGIVALARKLLIALWRYLETGVPPVGAVLKA